MHFKQFNIKKLNPSISTLSIYSVVSEFVHFTKKLFTRQLYESCKLIWVASLYFVESLRAFLITLRAFLLSHFQPINEKNNIFSLLPTNPMAGSRMRRSFDKKVVIFVRFFSKKKSLKKFPLTSEADGSVLLAAGSSSVSMATSLTRPWRFTHVTTKCWSGFESFSSEFSDLLCKWVIIWKNIILFIINYKNI